MFCVCICLCVPLNFRISRPADGTVIHCGYRELETRLADTCPLPNVGSRRTALTAVTRDHTVAARLWLLTEMNTSSILCQWPAQQDIPPSKVAQGITLLTACGRCPVLISAATSTYPQSLQTNSGIVL
jgi:hypothetical protein